MPGLIDFTHVACKFDGHRDNLATDYNATVGVDRWHGTAIVPGTVFPGSASNLCASSGLTGAKCDPGRIPKRESSYSGMFQLIWKGQPSRVQSAKDGSGADSAG